VSGKYKPGDLVCLNQYGFFITADHDGFIGIIVSGPYSIIAPVETIMDTFYTVYDILLDGQLFKMVPEEFMESYGKYEENTE
tara:strand:- start:1241 stop:1486 length:246 start_codon:yes stop_codon:yes gene_type:complete